MISLARRWLWPAVVAVGLAASAAVAALDRGRVADAIVRADPATILVDAKLAHPAIERGKAGFADHCAACHGDGHGNPSRGIPDLTDRDYLYGSGKVAEIEQIVLHGIRSGDPRGWHLAAMPAYARPLPYAAEPAIKPLSPGEIADVVAYLRRDGATDAEAVARGHGLFTGRGACWDCHEPGGEGNSAIGAPNLNDTIWLYGNGSAAALTATLARGRAGSCPAFARHLSPVEARSIAVYVASLPDASRAAAPARRPL